MLFLLELSGCCNGLYTLPKKRNKWFLSDITIPLRRDSETAHVPFRNEGLPRRYNGSTALEPSRLKQEEENRNEGLPRRYKGSTALRGLHDVTTRPSRLKQEEENHSVVELTILEWFQTNNGGSTVSPLWWCFAPLVNGWV